jgi:Putative addiction module component
MSLPLDALESQVMNLAPSDRSHLLDRLIASLEMDSDIDEAWTLEAARRDIEAQTGQDSPLSGSTVVARLLAKIQ